MLITEETVLGSAATGGTAASATLPPYRVESSRYSRSLTYTPQGVMMQKANLHSSAQCAMNIYLNWVKCDSHIRATHSCIAYGPCPMCMTWSTFNRDSWHLHTKHRFPFLKVQGGECNVPELTKAPETEFM